MADRIAVLDHGKIIQIGTPEEIYNNPASAFVADFDGVLADLAAHDPGEPSNASSTR